MRAIWSGPVSAHRDAADRLSDVLGDHHNLAVFTPTVLDASDVFAEREEREIFVGLIEQRQFALADDAFDIGLRVFAEKSSALSARWKTYWQVWRAE